MCRTVAFLSMSITLPSSLLLMKGSVLIRSLPSAEFLPVLAGAPLFVPGDDGPIQVFQGDFSDD
jgi:hypothetical protein